VFSGELAELVGELGKLDLDWPPHVRLVRSLIIQAFLLTTKMEQMQEYES